MLSPKSIFVHIESFHHRASSSLSRGSLHSDPRMQAWPDGEHDILLSVRVLCLDLQQHRYQPEIGYSTAYLLHCCSTLLWGARVHFIGLSGMANSSVNGAVPLSRADEVSEVSSVVFLLSEFK